MDERSARHTGLYMTTYNTQKRQASMLAAGFRTTIPASERKQNNALDCAVSGIGLGTNRLSNSAVTSRIMYFSPWPIDPYLK